MTTIDCTPEEETVTTIQHPAIGEPTVTVANPDYVPAVPGFYSTVNNPEYVAEVPAYETIVHHEAVVVDHPAIVHTEWKYVKHGGPGEIWSTSNDFKYIKANGEGSNSKPHHGVYYERTSKTQVIVEQEAYTEVISPAWDEVVVIPAIPAIGEPTIEVWIESVDAIGDSHISVENPDYVPAWTEEVIVEAVECPVVAPETSLPVVEDTTEAIVVVPVSTTEQPQLAVTGGVDAFTPLLLGAAFVASGIGLLIRKAVKA